MEKILDIIMGLLKGADWGQILSVLMTTINTFLNMIGKGQ